MSGEKGGMMGMQLFFSKKKTFEPRAGAECWAWNFARKFQVLNLLRKVQVFDWNLWVQFATCSKVSKVSVLLLLLLQKINIKSL